MIQETDYEWKESEETGARVLAVGMDGAVRRELRGKVDF